MARKKLPVGIENFEEIIKEDFYYVDKTAFISELIGGWSKVNFFTRPRRFGKSLTMSMLKHFFEIGGDKSIFDGLKVSEDKALCERYMGRYPVVSISLKGVSGLTFEEAYEMLRVIIRNEANRFEFLRGSASLVDREKAAFDVLTSPEATPADIKGSLQMLCKLLEKHYGKKVILLIDEYDVPLDKAYVNGYYPKMIDLMREMLGAALKTNDSLYFAVLTGCLRVSKESIFTGLNNLKVRSISDRKFDEYFGFTDEEVRRMLSDYGLEEHYTEMRDWYDGYLFGGQYVYCPWDVINYCDDLCTNPEVEPKAYWINTSGNDLVRKLIDKTADSMVQIDIERLIDGETITKTINEQLTHSEIDSSIDNIWSLLYMTGYLTITGEPVGDSYVLRIPNREVREIYKKQVLAWFNDKARTETDRLGGLYAAFEAGDTSAISELLTDQLYYTVSFYDAYESFYHGFLLALLSTCAQWNVTSNAETGKGRSDILVWRKDRKVGFAIEIKNVRETEALETACDEAMAQLREKDYTALLRKYGVREIIMYGMAFCDKSCVVRAEANSCS